MFPGRPEFAEGPSNSGRGNGSAPDFAESGSQVRVLFGLPGLEIAERRVDALPIVAALDVSERVAESLIPGRHLR